MLGLDMGLCIGIGYWIWDIGYRNMGVLIGGYGYQHHWNQHYQAGDAANFTGNQGWHSCCLHM